MLPLDPTAPLDAVVVTDGRTEYLQRSLDSWVKHGAGPFAQVIVVDDSADAQHAYRVEQMFPGATIVHHPEKRGMAAAVRSGWSRITSGFALHLEEDFVQTRPLPDLAEVCDVLATHEGLANMGFEREPWWGIELELGQLAAIKSQSSWFAERDRWSEHDHIYSLNPHVVPRRTFRWGWPDGNEAGQTRRMLGQYDAGDFLELFGDRLAPEDQALLEGGTLGPFRFGCWGHVGGPTYYEHIGHLRSSGWRL